jgi:hypothetical protein
MNSGSNKKRQKETTTRISSNIKLRSISTRLGQQERLQRRMTARFWLMLDRDLTNCIGESWSSLKIGVLSLP